MIKVNINNAILDVFKKKEIYSFPIDCLELLKLYGFKAKSYNSQSPKKKQGCFIISNDAFTLKKTVFYNDDMPEGRIRFSLMHELGHHVLEHSEPRTEQHENEANYFASHILAPRMAIHYAKCKNLNDVSKVFSMTFEAADYAFQDYRRWHRHITYHKMNEFDKALYEHFYNKEYKGFVYSSKQCTLCGKRLINVKGESCFTHTNVYRFQDWEIDKLEKSLLHAEKDWLYGGI